MESIENIKRDYDKTDAMSIFGFSRHLLNSTLAKAVKDIDVSITRDMLIINGKGGLGQLVEKYFYGYNPNSDPRPDFWEAGVELKTTPLKKLMNEELTIKERLVCDMIDYCEIVNVPFEESNFYKKSILMLIIFYLHVKGRELCDLEFIYSVLWQIKEKDLLIIRHDYETIQQKVRKGLAHELSEGDTMYLGASRKGQKNDSLRVQPFNEIGAPRRAFSLKPAYMRNVLDFVRSSGRNMATNVSSGIHIEELVTAQELQKESFEDILCKRFDKYKNLNYQQMSKSLGITVAEKEKSKFSRIAKEIMKKGLTAYDNAEEIRKAGIVAKTIRVQKNGTIRESMSFENINYDEIYENDEWYESRWYEIVTSKFMFVIFRETGEIAPYDKDKSYVFDRLVFWTMPQSDILTAEEYWRNIRENVLADTLTNDNNTFWRLRDHRYFHVRPKARYASDKYISPVSGTDVPKKAYWFNGEYVTKIIRDAYGDDWGRTFKNN